MVDVSALLRARASGSGPFVPPTADDPPVATSQQVFVSKAGNDANSGQQNAPVLTLAAAMALITDASPTRRYVVWLGPGDYADNFALKASVMVCGTSPTSTRITCPTISLDSTWTPAGDHRSGFRALTITGGAKLFDFSSVASNEGKLLLTDVSFSQKPTFTAQSAINQVVLLAVRLFAGYTQNGINMTLADCYSQNAGLHTVQDTAGVPAVCQALGGGGDGGWSILATGGAGCTVELLGWGTKPSATLTLNGAGASLAYSAGAVPGNVVLLGGATDPRPSVTGSRGANAALASLLTRLQGEGLIVDNSS